MNTKMNFEILRFCEALGAYFTLERPLVCVKTNMTLELARRFEALQANFAVERSISIVNSVMNFECPGVLETL